MPSLLELLVQASLPIGAKYGLENFAGDPHVKTYLDSLTDRYDLDLEVYVSWESPPDVQVIAGQTESALLRSERLDTLLAEFQRMQKIQPLLGGNLADDLVRSALLRWIAEMLIGYRRPDLAMDALLARPHLPEIETDIYIPFRDESLAALPAIERCALQCFCLGHEVGHLVTKLDVGLSLETPVDGVSLLSHIDYEYRAARMPENEIEMYRLWAQTYVDPEQLHREIRCDFVAVDSLTEFLHRYLGCSLEEAIRCTLEAYEAQVFLYELKECCRLVSLLAAGEIIKTEYAESQLVSITQTTARSRAVVRRAGLVWATLEAHRTGSEPDYASYVPRVDAILYHRSEQNQRLVSQLTALANELGNSAMIPGRREFRPDLLNQLFDANPKLRAEVYFILLLFGCPGSVHVEEYLAQFA